MIGGQRQRKDPASVVNAWASIPELVEGTNMIVVGEIPNNYLHANSIAAIESERLRFISGISSDELRDLIIGSLGTVFNSAGEGWGLPLAESLTCGSPTICNDLPVFKEVCGDNALYFESNDLNSCIEKMIRVSSSSFDREEYFKRATKFASKYQIENIVKQWQQLLIQPK
jgi:glycosyltransferase involved in cell wall biosynthesis